MHSLVRLVAVAGVLEGVQSAVLRAPSACTTPAPSANLDALIKRQEDPDAISLAQILLTAIPASLRQIAATDIPAVSSILWEDFLDDKRPEWFLELPDDIQSYLIRKFGPQTAWPTEPPASTAWEWPSATTTTTTNGPDGTSQAQPSSPSEGATEPAATSAVTSAATSAASTHEPESTALTVPTTLISSGRPTSIRSTKTVSFSSTTPSSLSTMSINPVDPSADPSPTDTPDSPPASNNGLSKSQKLGLGLGIPFGLLGAAALAFGCYALLRRRQKKNVDGSIPPSSPGFIPRFAFQERPAEDLEHRTPLNRDVNHSILDSSHTDWDDEGIDPMEAAPMHNPYTMKTPYTVDDHGSNNQPSTGAMLHDPAPAHHPPDGGMSMYNPTPVMAPALFHTHSSNRARGMRTSYTSLHSVAEVAEPDEPESPVLGRRISPKQSPVRNLMPTPPIPAGATIKRKPVSASPPLVLKSSQVSASPAVQTASRRLLRQTMPEHSGSSSSGLALTTSSGFNSSSSGVGVPTEMASPVSPISNRAPSNPFHYDSYVEDYGPEYQGECVDVEDGLYGGHTSLSRYPESQKKNSKTEWPLRNIVGSGHRRKSSPLWDRIYEE